MTSGDATVRVRTSARTADRRLSVAVWPKADPMNPFCELFSRSLEADAAFRVRDLNWRTFAAQRNDAVILHWPHRFFTRHKGVEAAVGRAQLALLETARRVYGARAYWVVHNLWPHDLEQRDAALAESFLKRLDGAIYLSAHSRRLARQAHPALAGCRRELIIRHGHYRGAFETAPSPWRPPGADVQFSFFGRIMPYKGVEDLAAIFADNASGASQLHLAGRCQDAALARRLSRQIAAAPRLSGGSSKDYVPQSEFERAIDASHGVILPYRDILNSGSALLALSRNRPVLAPALGSLPELQADVGEGWLQLYDGDLSASVIRAFEDFVRTRPGPGEPNLSLYDWTHIGAELRAFLAAG
ncbi:MAG: hypothetical protein AAGL49_00060 [Pseudomonadota bacterium]